jgi:hypothetical protein
LIRAVEYDIGLIEKWTRLNKLKVNFKKCNFVLFARSKKYYPWVNMLRCGNSFINRVYSTRYLGIIVDETLSFSDHIIFQISFSENYREIGLSLNAAKCEVLIFNELGLTRVDDASIDLNGIGVKPCDKLTYLGLPIGKNLKKTKQLMLENMESKIRRSYGAIVSSQFHLNRALLARIYNSVSLSHILYLVPFCRIFSEFDRLRMKRAFFRYAKFLLRVPPWTRNSYLIRKYSLSDPCVKLCELNAHMSSKETGHEWQNVIF